MIDTKKAADVAVSLLKAAAELAPSVADLLRRGAAGGTDPLSRRVADILPEESESEKAARELRAEQGG